MFSPNPAEKLYKTLNTFHYEKDKTQILSLLNTQTRDDLAQFKNHIFWMQRQGRQKRYQIYNEAYDDFQFQFTKEYTIDLLYQLVNDYIFKGKIAKAIDFNLLEDQFTILFNHAKKLAFESVKEFLLKNYLQYVNDILVSKSIKSLRQT